MPPEYTSLAAGLAIGLAAIGSGYAIAHTGRAASAAIAERPELFGRLLIFVALAEAIAIYGLLMSFMLWTKI